jgi:hypothetical protein
VQSALHLAGMVNAKFLLGSRYGFEMVDDALATTKPALHTRLTKPRIGQLKIYAK